jgi:hypothetical protein
VSSWPGVGALADDREPGGISELPSVEVLWLLTASLAGKGGELPSVEVLWLLTTSLAGTGCDDSILDRRVSGETEFGTGEYLRIMLDASCSPAVSPISLNRTACFDFLAFPAVFGLPSRFLWDGWEVAVFVWFAELTSLMVAVFDWFAELTSVMVAVFV